MVEDSKPKPTEVHFQEALGKFKAGGTGPFYEGVAAIKRGTCPKISRLVPWAHTEKPHTDPDSFWIGSGFGESRDEGRKVYDGDFHSSKRVGFDEHGNGIYDNFTFHIRYEESAEGKKYSAETTSWKYTALGAKDTQKTPVVQGEVDADAFPPEEFVELFSEFTDLNAAWKKHIEDNKHAAYFAPKREPLY